MARIATGSIVADITGKVGDNIYSRNRQGPYVKSYVSPIQPNTSYQLTARQALIDANAAWNNLSDADYLAYVAFTSLFSKSKFNGSRGTFEPRSFFIGNYINQVFCGDTPNPQTLMPKTFKFDSFRVDIQTSGKMYIEFVGAPVSPYHKSLLFSHEIVNKSVRSLNTMPLAFFFAGIPPANPYANYEVQWQARFTGPFQSNNKRLFVRGKVIDRFSGIMIADVWNSDVYVGSAAPFDAGIQTILPLTAAVAARRAFMFTPSSNGFINSITIYHLNVPGNFLFGVYYDSSNHPANRLHLSASIPIDAGSGWQTYTLPSPLAISNGVPVWIAFVADVVNVLKYGSDLFPADYNVTTDFLLPDPFGSPLSGSASLSVYCSGTYS